MVAFYDNFVYPFAVLFVYKINLRCLGDGIFDRLVVAAMANGN
jgi:hypothetical protein